MSDPVEALILDLLEWIGPESVSAGVILTHCVEVKLTHLGEDRGFSAAEDANPGASSGDQSDGPARHRCAADRARARMFS